MKQPPIRNWEELASSLRNYEWLPDGVQASDVDAMVHASNGKGGDAWLCLEFKACGRKLPMGQRMLLEGLRRLGMTVVVIYGPDSDDLYVASWDWSGKFTRDELADMVAEWWRVNKLPRKGAA